MISDRELFEDAVKLRVMLVSPTNLLATLKAIEYGWRSERQSKNVQDIFRLAGDLYDKFTGFADDLEELGSRLEQAHQSFESAKGKLVSGKGNLTRRVERLRDLGAKNSKSLPVGWSEGGELPESESLAGEKTSS
jgi:DNA recombination protein RmuC